MRRLNGKILSLFATGSHKGRGVAWRGVAWRGVAWRGVAWRGVAWRGVAWRGVAWQYCSHQLNQMHSSFGHIEVPLEY